MLIEGWWLLLYTNSAIGSKSAQHSEVHFHPLVVIFNLSLCLGVICSRKLWFNSKFLVKILCKVHCDCRPAISAMYKWNSMQFPDMMNVQFHKIRCGDVGSGRDEMHHLHESIGDNVNDIKPI